MMVVDKIREMNSIKIFFRDGASKHFQPSGIGSMLPTISFSGMYIFVTASDGIEFIYPNTQVDHLECHKAQARSW